MRRAKTIVFHVGLLPSPNQIYYMMDWYSKI